MVRRLALVFVLGLAGCATTAPAPVRALHWTGEATVLAGANRIELGVETRVVPLDSARSDSWLREKGRASMRSLVITRDDGWMERDGQRTDLPAPMVAQERLQFATYALMLPLPASQLERRPDVDGLRVMHARVPGAPEADLFFDASGRLVRLEDRVPNPEGTGTIAQRFDFEGTIESRGIEWPRTLRIAQDGKPWLELRIATFEAE